MLLRRIYILLLFGGVFYKFLLSLGDRDLKSVLHPVSLFGTKSPNHISDVKGGDTGTKVCSLWVTLALYLRKHAVFLSPFVFFIPFVNFKTIIMADLTKNKPELCVSIKGTTIVLKRIMLPAPQSFKSPDTSLRTSTEVLSFFISPLTFKY